MTEKFLSTNQVAQMITIRQKQKIWECHDYDLSPDQFKKYRKLSTSDKIDLLDSIGGTPVEYESERAFKFEVIK